MARYADDLRLRNAQIDPVAVSKTFRLRVNPLIAWPVYP